ncbi:MAG: retropepsin-like aspartic protease, partial [Sweet potato little leaf phytoplasma]|nr:retropepsin-like aspartic protease [Sweet potato little leaf phytoplasma]
FPQRLKKHYQEEHWQRFIDVFNKLHVNISFMEALANIPKYAQFMRDLLNKKKKCKVEEETVMLTEECSAILQRKLPPKLKDPGTFNLPCDIGGKYMGKALCDLGASVNIMPLSIFERLGIDKVTPTEALLQLADRSTLRP